MADGVLEGKVVMMTGAAQGMGREMALGIAAAGGKVVLVDIDEALLQETAADVDKAGGQGAGLPVLCDVASQQAAADALRQTLDRYGRLDVLVNDAVIGPESIGENFFGAPRKFWELDDNLWNAMLRVNIYGPQLMAKTVVGHMLDNGWGRIVNVTTSLDTMYRFGLGAYGPTKAALEAHTHIMAHDLEGTGVTANVLIPGGPVSTRMFPEDSGAPVELPAQAGRHGRADGLALLRRLGRGQFHALPGGAVGRRPRPGCPHRQGGCAGRLDPARRPGDLSG